MVVGATPAQKRSQPLRHRCRALVQLGQSDDHILVKKNFFLRCLLGYFLQQLVNATLDAIDAIGGATQNRCRRVGLHGNVVRLTSLCRVKRPLIGTSQKEISVATMIYDGRPEVKFLQHFFTHYQVTALIEFHWPINCL